MDEIRWIRGVGKVVVKADGRSDEQILNDALDWLNPDRKVKTPAPKVIQQDDHWINIGDEVMLDPNLFGAGQTGRVMDNEGVADSGRALVKFYNGAEQWVFKRDLLVIEPQPNPHNLKVREPSQEKLDDLKKKIQDAEEAGDTERARQLYEQYESVTASLIRSAETALDGLSGEMHDMVEAYLEAALWSSTDNTADNGGQPLDRHYGIGHIDKASIQKAIADCQAFVEKAGELLENANMTQVGHDFWLTRNGHGTGFWDRPEIYGKEQSQKLAEIAKSFGTSDATISWPFEGATISLSRLFR